MIFFRCFPVGGQLSLLFSEASEVVLIYSSDQICAKMRADHLKLLGYEVV